MVFEKGANNPSTKKAAEKKAGKAPEGPSIADVLAAQGEILGAINKINTRVKTLETVKSSPGLSRTIQDDGEVKSEFMEDSGVKGTRVDVVIEKKEPKLYPVPENYLEAKDQILGSGPSRQVKCNRLTEGIGCYRQRWKSTRYPNLHLQSRK